MNVKKTEFYSSGISEEGKLSIVRSTGFKVGILPVKYLGVPLLTRKLSISDCEPLLQMLRKRVENWTGKLLSYVGRLQLID